MKLKFLIGLIAVILGVIGIVIVLANENALVVHPRGLIAQHILLLIIINITLMLLIILPTYVLLFVVVRRLCIKNEKENYDPDNSSGIFEQSLMWGLPTIVVIAMTTVTWYAAHKLDPYKPIESEADPITIQVVAMDWKWLFIYPELGIATLNFFYIPEQIPIHFQLTADNAPMNSFWIPQLSGQIYSMTGMSTQLHVMANGIGDYVGRGAEINGEGYSGMKFLVKSVSAKDFEDWIAQVKTSSHHLTEEFYLELVKPAINTSHIPFSKVEDNLYHKIIHKYMYPTQPVL
jgi:cytochrome o ubiquinol oxidase subunit 2